MCTVRVCIVFSVYTSSSFHLTGQSLDAQNSKPNIDTELKNSQGNQRVVHGCQQTLMKEKLKHFILFFYIKIELKHI